MTLFLSKENFEHVFSICRDFLKDVANIQIQDPAELQRAVAFEMRNLAASLPNFKAANIDSLNKMVIVNIRKKFTTNTPQEPEPEQTQAIVVQQETNHNNNNSGDDDQVFFKKLKNLELQRSVPTPQQTSNNVVVQPTVVVPEAPPPTTIVVRGENIDNAIRRVKHVLCISSHNRMWIYERRRNPCIVNKELASATMDILSLRVCKVIIPRSRRGVSPFYYLHIEGVGKQNADIILVPQLYTKDESFIELECPSVDAAYIPMLSMPWTVAIRDNCNNDIDFGTDGWYVSRVQADTHTKIHILHFDRDLDDVSFAVNDMIEIHNTNMNVKTTAVVCGIHANSIAVQADEGVILECSCVVNTSRQINILIEWCEKNE